jgi:peptidoglycan hydrolase-like protein with peptidoglycan-binding domain
MTAAMAAAFLSTGGGIAVAQQGALPASLASVDTSAVAEIDRSTVARLQVALNQRGFDPQGIDGVAGPRTREAVRAFQERYGMKVNGVITNQLLFALGLAELTVR